MIQIKKRRNSGYSLENSEIDYTHLVYFTSKYIGFLHNIDIDELKEQLKIKYEYFISQLDNKEQNIFIFASINKKTDEKYISEFIKNDESIKNSSIYTIDHSDILIKYK